MLLVGKLQLDPWDVFKVEKKYSLRKFYFRKHEQFRGTNLILNIECVKLKHLS